MIYLIIEEVSTRGCDGPKALAEVKNDKVVGKLSACKWEKQYGCALRQTFEMAEITNFQS